MEKILERLEFLRKKRDEYRSQKKNSYADWIDTMITEVMETTKLLGHTVSWDPLTGKFVGK